MRNIPNLRYTMFGKLDEKRFRNHEKDVCDSYIFIVMLILRMRVCHYMCGSTHGWPARKWIGPGAQSSSQLVDTSETSGCRYVRSHVCYAVRRTTQYAWVKDRTSRHTCYVRSRLPSIHHEFYVKHSDNKQASKLFIYISNNNNSVVWCKSLLIDIRRYLETL